MLGGIGSIVVAFPHKVGLVRNVKVKTVTAIQERPGAKLCLLLEADIKIRIII